MFWRHTEGVTNDKRKYDDENKVGVDTFHVYMYESVVSTSPLVFTYISTVDGQICMVIND